MSKWDANLCAAVTRPGFGAPHPVKCVGQHSKGSLWLIFLVLIIFALVSSNRERDRYVDAEQHDWPVTPKHSGLLIMLFLFSFAHLKMQPPEKKPLSFIIVYPWRWHSLCCYPVLSRNPYKALLQGAQFSPNTCKTSPDWWPQLAAAPDLEGKADSQA